MICQGCGVEAPTRRAAFYQNIGMLVARESKSIKGDFCKKCIGKYFWSMTGVTAALGWWGTISLFVAPVYILNNLARYVMCLGMAPPAPDAKPPELTNAAVEKLAPLAREMFDRLNHESFEHVAQNTAIKAGVTPGQVCLFMQAVARQSQNSG